MVQRLVQQIEYDGRQGKVAITFHPLDNPNSNGQRTSQVRTTNDDFTNHS
jgi:hypothetical protein